MTNQKLLMFAMAGALLPAADAAAEVRGAPFVKEILPHPANDLAPVTGTAPNVRLRRTDEEQPGMENGTVALFADGKSGLYFAAATELPGRTPADPVRPATKRVQLAKVPFTLTQAATGQVQITADPRKAEFITNNDGNEYRNSNASVAFTADEGNAVCVRYNYQPNNTNDTKMYLQCFNAAGATLLPQTEAFAKNNDDCSMAEVKPQVLKPVGNKQDLVFYHGCNGNGRDDGWVGKSTLTKQANGNFTYARAFDVSVIAQEERSRGDCFIGPDQTFAVCAGTQGNNQPQREGVYLFAIDLASGAQGQNQQQTILWRKQIAGRTQIDGKTTYSMRAMINGIQKADATGAIAPTNQLIWRHGALQGNNQNNRKGGQYVENQVAVIEFSRAGFQYVTPLTPLARTELLGVDGTHNLNTFALIGEGSADTLKPAILIQNGSHTGGQGGSVVRALQWDAATKKFSDQGDIAGGNFDHHYYPNYLGNNPGNQGRNQATAFMVKNPFFGQLGNNDQFIVVNATTAKGNVSEFTPARNIMNPAVKLAAYLSVTPIASGPKAAVTGTSGGTTGTPTTEGETETETSDSSLGGCSTGGSTGLATFLLIGLAALIRRRR